MSLGARSRRGMLRGLAALTALTAVLAGCASVPPPVAPVPGPADPQAQHYAGRLAVRIEGDAERSFSSSFELQGTDRAGTLSLTSPLGTLIGRAAWQPGDVRLQTGDGERRYDSLDDLARAALGDSVPIGALFDWLAGRPWTHAASTPLPVAGDAGFQQLGWLVRTGRLADGLLLTERPDPAPAKLNLFLHVVGRRADGYHLLQSVFTLIDWCDTLHVERRTDGRISREDLGPALPEDDLCTRAARLLQQASGTRQGAHIAIDKQVPWGAGLGGGSSDAATTLLALNRLWDLHWPRHRLLELGLQLGADVPFFIGGHNAWVEGIGERLTPITLAPATYVVLKPPVAVPTAVVFSSPLLTRNTPPTTMAVFLAEPKTFGKNDLQAGAEAYSTQIVDGLEILSQNFGLSRMSGSGSAVFAPWNDHPRESCNDSSALPAQLTRSLATRGQNWVVRRCRSLDHHPMRNWCPD